MRNYGQSKLYSNICNALLKVGIDAPEIVSTKDWNYRLRLNTGQYLDVFWNSQRRASSFDFFHRGTAWTEELRVNVRIALQKKLKQRIKPSEKYFWPSSKWKIMERQDAFEPFVDISVNHAPLKTILDLKGYLPEKDGEVKHSDPIVAHIEIKYIRGHKSEVLNSDGSQEMISYGFRMLAKAGVEVHASN